MTVIKRNGSIEKFSKQKIIDSIKKANSSLSKEFQITSKQITRIAIAVATSCIDLTEPINIDKIEDLVEEKMMEAQAFELAKSYIKFRYRKELIRKSNTTDESIKELIEGSSEYWNTENSNKDAKVVTTQRDYLAGITSTDISKRLLLPKDVVDAHDAGIIHFHDMDYFAQNALNNCCLINLNDMLQNGTMINGVKIDKPHRLLTATTIATQIITAVASSQYGGCSINLADLAPFVRMSHDGYVEKYLKRGMSDSDSKKFANEDTLKEIVDSVQTFNYQINSMSTTNGQAPFLTVFMYLNQANEYKDELAMLIEEFLNQRILGMKNKNGVYVTPAFPKLIYVLEEDNITKDSKYWYLTELSAKCTSKRMVPDYISEKVMKKLKVNGNGDGDCYSVMGCRSALTPDKTGNGYNNIAKALDYEPGKPKYSGRFNQGVVTINLADVALSSGKDMDKFWKIFDERLELCHRALQVRHKRLSKVTSDVAPILWQHGAFARLEPGESVHPLLHGGYSTISLGYAALYECVKYMTGESHTAGKGKEFGLKVMQHMNDKCAEWKEVENIDYSLYGTPIESTTYKFAKCLQKRFGIIPGITDKDYITNSYHVHVTEKIDAFEKLRLESEFQRLSPGGAISYVETPDLTKNVDAVLSLMQFIYDNIMYAELNCKSDYCMNCGYDGEIEIQNDLTWKCPNCGNTDQSKMSVTRRTCGYLGSHYWNKGRTQEIKERVLHLDNFDHHCC